MALEPLTVNQLVGRNVWRLRHDRGWSQPELAERLQGLTQETGKQGRTKDQPRWNGGLVSRCEYPPDGTSYQRDVPLEDIMGFARVFKVSVVELLTPWPGETVKLGEYDEMPADAFMWLMFRGATPAEIFAELQAELERLVREGKFAGWVTEDRLARGESFLPWERAALASEDFEEWETPDTGRELTKDEIENPTRAEPREGKKNE